MELDRERVVGHDDGHQRAVLGGDVLVVEADVAREAEHAAVPVRPVVHPASSTLRHMWSMRRRPHRGPARSSPRKPGRKRPPVVLVRHERVDRVSVGGNRGVAQPSVFVGPDRPCALTASAPRATAASKPRRHRRRWKQMSRTPSPWSRDVIVERAFRSIGRGQDDAGLALLKGVGAASRRPGLEPA